MSPTRYATPPLLAWQKMSDVYALAKIAGHSTVLITQRYIHEGVDAIERAFSKREVRQKALVSSGAFTPMGTKLGTA